MLARQLMLLSAMNWFIEVGLGVHIPVRKLRKEHRHIHELPEKEELN